MNDLLDLLSTVGPAGQRANADWATSKAAEHLAALRDLLPYKPGLPPDIRTHFAYDATLPYEVRKWLIT